MYIIVLRSLTAIAATILYAYDSRRTGPISSNKFENQQPDENCIGSCVAPSQTQWLLKKPEQPLHSHILNPIGCPLDFSRYNIERTTNPMHDRYIYVITPLCHEAFFSG